MNINSTGLYTSNSLGLYQSSQRLTTGLRINSASDDAAGLAISNNLSKQIVGQTQAMQNINDGVSLLEIHSGALGEISSLYGRARELAVQAANGTLTASDRTSLNEEYSQIMQQVDDIFTSTSFNGQTLFQNGGAPTTIDVQSGDEVGDLSALNSVDYSSISGVALPSDILTQANAQSAIGTLDTAMDNASLATAQLGASQNSLSTTYNAVESNLYQSQIARGAIQDANYAKEATELAKYQLLQSASFAMHKKVNESHAQMVFLLNQ